MEYCTYFSLCFMALVALTHSLGYDRLDLIRDAQRISGSRFNDQRLRSGNSYTNTLARNVGSTRVNGRSGCYDRCYDAYLSGLQLNVRGCSCSRFDFQRNRGSSRRNQINSRSRPVSRSRSSNNNCNCPVGTACEYQFGTVNCIRVNSINRNINNPRYDTRNINRRNNNFGNTNARVNLGVPGNRRLGGHCGYLTPACVAPQTDSRQVLRYTYNYEMRACVREHVYLDCEVLGSRNNLFNSRQGCTRTCF